MKGQPPTWAERLCPSCNECFRPKHSTQIHCCSACAQADARELKAVKAALQEKRRNGRYHVSTAPAVACPQCHVRKIRPGFACRCGYCDRQKAPLTPFPSTPPQETGEEFFTPRPLTPPDTREYLRLSGGPVYVKTHVACRMKEGWRILPGSGEYSRTHQAVTLYRETESPKC